MPRKSSLRLIPPALLRPFGCAAAAASIAACSGAESADDMAAAPQSAALQAPGAVDVAEISARGSGCPGDSWRSTTSEDGSRVTMAFDAFRGDVTSRSAVTRSCAISLSLRGQEGYQYAAASVRLSGSATSSITYGAALMWSGTSEGKTLTAKGGGSFDKLFVEGESWSPCGSDAKLLVTSQIEADGQSRPNTFELEEAVVAFRARPCTTPPPPDPPAGPDGEPKPSPQVPSERAPSVSILGAGAAGAGCPPASTKVLIAPDGRAVTLGFDSLNGARSAACTITLQIEAPAGQAYALAGFTALGQATLNAGDRARFLINTAYTGLGVDLAKERTREIVGPTSGPVKLDEVFEPHQLHFSPCDGTKPSLRLSVRPTLSGTTGSTFQLMQIESLQFALRSCP